MSLLLITTATPCTTTSLTPFISSTLSLPFTTYHKKYKFKQASISALHTGSSESYGPDLLRKPIVSQPPSSSTAQNPSEERDEERLVDWEDKILEDTAPLVGFVRMILHSGKYQSGDRLSPEHETMILERLLPFHPECEKKIGSGVDYITIGYHPQFEDSRCLFIVRKNGELVDFSYWKCIKGLIKKNYPLYADSFILKQFRRRRR